MKGLWAFLVRALFVAFLSVAVVGMVGCGDDSDNGGGDGDGDTGGDGDGDGDTGDTGDGDGDTGGGACEADLEASGQSAECATCLCAACDVATLTACDETCWSLISCIGQCQAETGDDTTTCATGPCIDFIAGGTAAMPVGACAFADDENDCTAACGSSGGDGDGDTGGDGDDGDAGAEDAGL